jgi:hypothetical protein
MSKVYELAFKLGGSLNSSFSNTFKTANKQIHTLNDSVGQLKDSKSDIDMFQKLRTSTEKTAQKFNLARLKMNKLKKEIASTEKPSKKLIKQLETETKKRDRLEKSLVSERAKLSGLNRTMIQSGINTKDLSSENERLARSIEKSSAAQKRMNSLLSRQRANQNKRSESRGKLLDAVAIGYSAKKVIDAYGDVATAQGQIASLGIDETGIQAITKAAVNYSNKWSGTYAADFIAASYDIKSGIASLSSVAVGEYTRIAALTAKATKYTTEEMTGLMATGFGIYRNQFESFGNSVIKGWKDLSNEEKDIEFGKYFSAGISASVQAFKTEGSQMKEYFTTLGAEGTSNKSSMSEQLAIGGMLQRTMTGSEAATKYASFLNSAFSAGEKLGLDFVDEDTGQLKNLADILDTIKEEYGELDAAANNELKEAFGRKEASNLVKLLINDTDELRKSTSAMEKSLKGGMKLTDEMAKKMDRGPSASISLLMQRVSNLSAKVGKSLNPSLEYTTNILGEGILKVAAFAEKHQKLTAVVAGTAATLAVSTIATIAGGYAYTFLKGGILNAHKAYLFLRNSSIVATAAQWALNTALSANPISLVVLAIAGAALLIYKYWQPLSAFFSGFWIGLSEGMKPVIDMIKEVYNSVKPLFAVFVPIWDFFSGLITPVSASSEQLKKFSSWGQKVGKVFSYVAKFALLPFIGYLKVINFAAKTIGKVLAWFNDDDDDGKKTAKIPENSKIMKQVKILNEKYEFNNQYDNQFNNQYENQFNNPGVDLNKDISSVNDMNKELTEYHTNNNQKKELNINFAPVITIPPGMDVIEVNRSLEASKISLKEEFEQIINDEKRIDF